MPCMIPPVDIKPVISINDHVLSNGRTQSSRLTNLQETITPVSSQNDLVHVHPNVDAPILVSEPIEGKEWQVGPAGISDSVSYVAETIRQVGSSQAQSTPVAPLVQRPLSNSKRTSANYYNRLYALTIFTPTPPRRRIVSTPVSTEQVDSDSRSDQRTASSSKPLESDQLSSLRRVAISINTVAGPSGLPASVRGGSSLEMTEKNGLTAVIIAAMNHPNSPRVEIRSKIAPRRRRLLNISRALATTDLELREISDNEEGTNLQEEVHLYSNKKGHSQKPPPSLIDNKIPEDSTGRSDPSEKGVTKNGGKKWANKVTITNSHKSKPRKEQHKDAIEESNNRSCFSSVSLRNLIVSIPKIGSPRIIGAANSKKIEKNWRNTANNITKSRIPDSKYEQESINAERGGSLSPEFHTCPCVSGSKYVEPSAEKKEPSAKRQNNTLKTFIESKRECPTTKRLRLQSGRVESFAIAISSQESSNAEACNDFFTHPTQNTQIDSSYLGSIPRIILSTTGECSTRSSANVRFVASPARGDISDDPSTSMNNYFDHTNINSLNKSCNFSDCSQSINIYQKKPAKEDINNLADGVSRSMRIRRPNSRVSALELYKNKVSLKKTKRLSMYVPMEGLGSVSLLEPKPENQRDSPVIIKDPITDKEIEMIDRFGNPAAENDEIVYSKIITETGLVAGYVYLRPFATLEEDIKPSDCDTIYDVIKGELILDINDKSYLLNKGDHFEVPSGTGHSLKNTTPSEAKLNYKTLFCSANLDSSSSKQT